MARICGIYKITNKINNKIYIGQSVDIKRRWSDEKSRSNNNSLCLVSALYSALHKYGVDNFTFEIIEECNETQLNEREAFWINKFNSIKPNGYNILKTAEQRIAIQNRCPRCGKIIGPTATYCEECAHIMTRKVERPNKEELAKLIYEKGGFAQVAWMFDVADNTIRKWCKGYELPTHTKELKDWYRINILHIEPLIKKEKIEKPVILQIDKNTNEVLNKFLTPKEACDFVKGSKSSHITEVCQGKRITAYGFKWKYE